MLLRLLRYFLPKGDGKPEAVRSSQWPATRAAHLKREPACQVCGTREKLEVHHIDPVHVAPSRELDPANLITLCETDHLVFGHLKSWHSWNIHCRTDAAVWARKIGNRPSKEKPWT